MVDRIRGRIGANAVAPPAPAPIKSTELVPPAPHQIMLTKRHIVTLKGRQAALSSQHKYLQSHIDNLEGQLASLDPTTVAAVIVRGYTPPKK